MPRTLFVTGKLAAPSLRKTLEGMASGFEHEIAVLPISVAALMDTRFLVRHLTDAMGCERVMLPGLCRGDSGIIEDRLGVEVVRGPVSLKDIPDAFGESLTPEGYGEHRVKIFAEIVDAHQMSLGEILERASYFKASGADIIDLGSPVEGSFPDVEKVIGELKSAGFSVSLDSFNEEDILKADQAGVDFLLSVNSRNMELARRLRCKVVVLPDFEQGLESLERNIAILESWRVPYIIDPVLNPIGFGFAESIEGFIAMRRRHPKAEMLMGLGNLTELTEADTAGITAVMAGLIEELGIDYVLTTEVIHWARGAIRELDAARRLMYYACRNKMLPKHLDDGLLTAKDPPFATFTENELRDMQAEIRDRNFRIFSDEDYVYVFNNQLFVKETNIQEIFLQLGVRDSAEAFYLGRELQKAALARKLGKKYIQEEELRWGCLDAGNAETQGKA